MNIYVVVSVYGICMVYCYYYILVCVWYVCGVCMCSVYIHVVNMCVCIVCAYMWLVNMWDFHHCVQVFF